MNKILMKSDILVFENFIYGELEKKRPTSSYKLFFLIIESEKR